MGNPGSKPQNMDLTDSVVKNKNENGLHVFTINLDANQDGRGVSPWSVVGIIILTIIMLLVLKKLRDCCCKCDNPWTGQGLPFFFNVEPRDAYNQRRAEEGVALNNVAPAPDAGPIPGRVR